MKNILIWSLCTLPLMTFAHYESCDKKLDALSKTLFRVTEKALEAKSSLEAYQSGCCESCADILKNRASGSQCLCSTFTIYEPTELTESGAYCLANDIFGDITTAAGKHISLDLKGHVVQGNVSLDEHGYVHNGVITNSLTLLSHGFADSVTVTNLVGSLSENVLAKNCTLKNPGVIATGFTSLVLDSCIIQSPGTTQVVTTSDLVLRRTQVFGDIHSLDGTLKTLSVYDTHFSGELRIDVVGNLEKMGIWNSSMGALLVNFNGTAGQPTMMFHGVVTPIMKLDVADFETHNGTRLLIDTCDCGNILLSGITHIHCQDTLATGTDIFNRAAVDLQYCHQGVFDTVQAFNYDYASESKGFKTYQCQDILFKKCYATAVNNIAFDVFSTSTSVNFVDCIAKGSQRGFYMLGYPSGSVINCVADGCLDAFTVENADVPVVYASNVACFNVGGNYNYAGSPFYDANYTVTASGWRNISL